MVQNKATLTMADR